MRGSGLTQGLIRVYLSGRHSLRPTLSHVKTQKRGLRKQMICKIGWIVRNLRLGGYGAFAHQHDQSFFCTPSFLALAMARVDARLRVYPPGQLSLCPTPYHVKT